MISREIVIETIIEELETASNEDLENIYNKLLASNIVYINNDLFKEM